MDQLLQIVGALLILGAFAAAQFRFLDQSSFVYLFFNLVGSALLGVIAYQTAQWGFVLLEVVWALVSRWGLIGLARARARTPAPTPIPAPGPIAPTRQSGELAGTRPAAGRPTLGEGAVERMQTWDLWYPEAAATGLPFARCRIDPVDVLWVHSAPPTLSVTVRDGDERVVAQAESLARRDESCPMTRLSLRNGAVEREDRWPTEADLGNLVVVPGGEAGKLVAWWNAPDGGEWRWQLEFYNHR